MIGDNSHREALFSVANEIDKKMAGVKPRATVLVGLSKVGKSTTINWIQRHPLRAVKQEIKETEVKQEEKEASTNKKLKTSKLIPIPKPASSSSKVVYVPDVIHTETAQVKGGFKSCTLVPNIVSRDNNTTTLIDMQGFGDNRDYVGTLAVSYSLKAIFETVEEIKFILVISESDLKENSGKSLRISMNHYLNLFDLSNADIKEKILRSTAMLVTQSQNPESYLELIANIVNNLDEPGLQNVENREEMVDLLTHIYYSNRIDHFPIAKLSEQPPPCKILEYFETKDWQYLKLKEHRPLNFIRLPFEKEFKAMTMQDQISFTNAIELRLLSYKTFSTIFLEMFEKILVEGKIHNIKLPYDQFFSQIHRFIFENDHYDCQREVKTDELRALEFRKPKKEILLKYIIELETILFFQDDHFEKSKEKMGQSFVTAINRFTQIILIIFCRNKIDAKSILQVRYILLRGVREFYMLFKVRQSLVAASFNTIHDRLQGILTSDFKDNLQKFVNSFGLTSSQRITFGPKNHANVLEAYFSSRQNAYAFEILFKLHPQKKDLMSSEAKDQYYQLMRDTNMIHAKYEQELGHLRESSEYLLQAYRLEIQYEDNCLRRVRYDLDRTVYLRLIEEMFLNQQNLLHMLKENLIKLNKFKEALQLSKEMGWVHSACEVYQLRLKESLNREQRETLIKEYAQYCLGHSRKEKGIMLLQQLQEMQRSSFNRKKQINKLIQKSIDNAPQFQEKYIEFLDSKDTIDLFKPERKTIISQIERIVRDHSLTNDIVNISKDYMDRESRESDLEADCKAILKRYLQERLKNEAVVAQNGFKVQYISSAASEYNPDPKTEQLCSKIKINNVVELEQLAIKLINLLEKEAKSLNPDKEKVFTIDLEKVTKNYQEISEKHMIITLNNQQIRPTYEYATKIMKNLRKITQQPFERLLSLIKKAVIAAENQAQGMLEQILGKFYAKRNQENELTDSSEMDIEQQLMKSQDLFNDNRQQVKKIISLVHQHPQASTEKIVERFFKEKTRTGLINSEVTEIVQMIKDRRKIDLVKDVAEEFQVLNQSNYNEQTFMI